MHYEKTGEPMDRELEKKLIEKVEQSGFSLESLQELSEFYKRNIPEEGIPWLVRKFAGDSEDVEKIAHCCLELGSEMEREGNYERAVLFYAYGLSVQPRTEDFRYFLNNNIGYSLVVLGRYGEARPYCEEAIRLNPNRYNAHKNLGLSLQGLGRYAEAAGNFMRAVGICHNIDKRAYNHLEELIARHPELTGEIEGIREFLDRYQPGRQDRVLH